MNKRTNQFYVYVFKIKFNIEEFGLKSPSITESIDFIVEKVLGKYLRHSIINESKGKHKKIIKQKDLKNIINECVDRYLRKYLNENVFKRDRAYLLENNSYKKQYKHETKN